MGKRKFLILCLLLVLLSIAGVSASDADNITVQADTDMSDECVVNAADDISVQTGNDTERLVVGAQEYDSQNITASSDDENTVLGRSLKELQELINNAPEGSEIHLNDNYFNYFDLGTVSISKNITIDGENHILTGVDVNTILSIDSDGKSVILKNIKFEHGKSDKGGAISNTHASTSLTIMNCEFDYNKADYGGAIYTDGQLKIDNSRFNNNTAGKGGAVYCNGESTITLTDFQGNKATLSSLSQGGAIYANKKCQIDSCFFKHNYAATTGGAVFARNDLEITTSTQHTDDWTSFCDNEAFLYAGAIYCDRNLYINWNSKNPTYIHGSYANAVGGAIVCNGRAYINNTNMSNNRAVSGIENLTYYVGGAIYAYYDVTVYNSYFYANCAAAPEVTGWANGGAIYCERGEVTCENSTFISNSVTDRGGAIFCFGFVNCKSSKFYSNRANSAGGAVSCYSGTFIDSIFEENLVKEEWYNWFGVNKACEGGAIHAWADCTIVSCTFNRNNATEHGGAICAERVNVSGNSSFINNSAYYEGFTSDGSTFFQNDGGAIYSNGKVTVNNAYFYNNLAGNDGGAIYSEGEVRVYNSEFTHNNASGSALNMQYGGAIRSKGNIEVNGCTFTRNFAKWYGGAIYADNGITIYNSTFSFNYIHLFHGGAVYCTNGEIAIYGSTFDSNRAGDNIYKVYGGAVYADGNKITNVKDCIFKDNTADNSGGAIYAEEICEISNSEFTGNKADKNEGGAIYTTTIGYISNSTFTENKALKRKSSGGAIYTITIGDISNSTFINNACDGTGGAIYAKYNDISIIGGTFTGNSANVDGGAIYSEGKTTIKESTFNGNKATGKTSSKSYGGAIRSEELITVENSRFENNTAYNWGGAIYADNDISITGSTFIGNSAKEAGAIFASTITHIVSQSVFLNNRAIDGDGGAINIWDECTPQFVSCRFEGNTAANRGGAIYVNDGDSQLRVSHCTFVDNHADKAHYSGRYNHGAGHSIFNKGHYNLMEMCWLGTNNPDFNELFTKFNKNDDDSNYVPGNRYLNIGIKINDTLYIGNNYEVTVYFYDCNGSDLKSNILHSTGHISGNVNISNLKVDYNDMTADAKITREDPEIVGELDHQKVTLKLTANNKLPSNITIEQFSIINITGIYVFCTVHPIPKSTSPYYVIMNSDGDIVHQGGMSQHTWHFNTNKFYFTVDDLPLGSYNVTAIYPESWDYLASNDTKSFEIIRNVSANITADNVVYGNNTTITLKADYDGTYNVRINDLVLEMNVTNGSCTKQIKLNAGEYKTHTNCTTDYVELSCNETSFNVSKANPQFNLNVSSNEFTYGDEILVSHILPSDATGNISYSLNKENYANLSVNDNLKLSLDAGSYLIDATYSGDTNYYPATDSITIKINPAKNKVTVSADNVTYGEDTIIKVSADADGIYAVDVNGTIYNVTVNNGTGNKTIALNAGTYYANATFNNKNYKTTYKNTAFSVYKADVMLNITVLDEVYPQDVEGVVHASRDGEYNLTIGEYKDTIIVKDGICYFNIGTLDAGSYEAIVSLNDNNYNPVSNRTKFVVNASGTLFEIEVNTSEITYGETVTVTHTINDGATGNITYLLSDSTLLGVLPVGKNLTLPILSVGHYVITADYSGDRDFIPASDIAFFTINKAPNNARVNVDNVTYGENTTIKISADVDGVYSVDINGTIHNITVNNGVGNKSIALNAGTYYANTTFNNKNYITKTKNTTFKVNKATNNIVITADNVTYGENTTIKITANLDAVYAVDINGTIHNITVNNGKGNKTITLNAGSYYASTTFNNDNYNTSFENAVFSVDKADTMLSVYVPTTVYLQDVIGVVYSSVDGEYNVTIGDYSTTVTVENVFGEFNAGILNAGEYILTATYSGDLNHKANSTTTRVYITKFAPNVTLNVSDIDCGEAAVITITSDIYGSVNVTVNNMTVTLDLDGTTKHILAATRNADSDSEYTATLQLDNLNSGTYPVTAVYIGDDNIESIFLSGEFKVNALNATINADASDINVGDDETITVTLPDDATGTVTATVDGKNYTSTVENGTASITIPDLTAGEKTADIYYSGDGKYNPAETTATFTVNKIKANMTVDTTVTSNGTAVIIVTLPEDATGTVTVTIDGKNYTTPVENGKATFNIPGLSPGKYEITATYSGDEKYEPNQGNSSAIVNDSSTKHENKTADKDKPDKKAIKSTDKQTLETTGNPIFVLLAMLMTIGITTIRRFKK